jgi:hypothetical protein
MKLSHEVVHNLKEISKISSVKRWEYAGGIEYDNFKFSTPTRITSKKRNTVDTREIEQVWYSEISYHTHPGVGYHEECICEKTPIYTTLPSNADFEVYIKGFPKMQVNIICDSHGYYIVDVLKSVYNRTTPLPEAVYEYMRKLRSRPFMRIGAFSEDGVEYFHTTLQNWKRYMNEEVNPEMIDLFGISIQYYGYDDDPPNVTIYRGIDVA